MTEPSYQVWVIHSGTLAPVVRHFEAVAVASVAAAIRHAYETDEALALALTAEEMATAQLVELREISGGR